jgi:hypothetical protein
MERGAGSKSPAWRLGSWLLGFVLLVSVPLWGWPLLDGMQWVLGVLAATLLGLAFTAPHAISRARGGPPYVPDVLPLRPAVSAGTFLAYLLLYRLPVSVGDALYTSLWNRLHGLGAASLQRSKQ